MTEQIEPATIVTASGHELRVAATAVTDHDELHAAFAAAVAAGEGYPQAPDEPVTWAGVPRLLDRPGAGVGRGPGAWSVGPRRGVHDETQRGREGRPRRQRRLSGACPRGVGAVSAPRSSSTRWPSPAQLGFDAMQFNFVFESNPARRLYERLGFELVGRVPQVIDGEAVCIYWRRL